MTPLARGSILLCALFCAFVVAFGGKAEAAAAPWGLDPAFGDVGTVINGTLGGVGAMALQSDGKIVVVGGGSEGFVVVRFDADGSLDPSFGTGGVVKTSFGGTSANASGVAVLGDGTIVVGGTAVNEGDGQRSAEFALAHYNTDGTLDTGFGGGDGKVTAPLGGDESSAHAMIVQADGKIVLAGSEYVIPANPDEFGGNQISAARFDADGTPDTTFGGGHGYVTTHFAGTAWGLAQQPDGKLVLAARVGDDFGVVRLDEDGTLDTSFGGGDGAATVEASQTGSQADSVVVRPSGKIVAGGWGYDTVIAQFNPDGSLDSSFGTGGVFQTTFPGYELSSAIVVALQSDGKLVFTGQAGDHFSTYEDFAIGRLDTDGTFDPTFGNGEGWVTIDVGDGASGNYANGLLIQPDGKLVVGGSTGSPEYKLGMVRYEEGGVPVPRRYLLSVSPGGHGRGSIASDVAGIECGFWCSHVYSEGTEVTLAATPESGFIFTGWSGGGCSGVGTCTVTMNAATNVVAEFGRTVEPAMPLSWTQAFDADPSTERGYESISCPSASLCVAVNEGGQVLTSTDPTGGAGAWSVSADLGEYLRAVDCASTSFCVISGREDVFIASDPSGGDGAWQRSGIGIYYSIESVSCPSESLCVASGGPEILTSTDPEGGQSAWSSHFETDPSGWIESISCASTTLCVAVGGSALSSTNPAGGASGWTTTTPNEGFGGLDSVSCPATNLCIALGEDGHGDDGFRTSTSPATVGSWSPYSYLPGYYFPTAVTCASSSLCVAGNWNGEVFATTEPAAGNAAWTAPDKVDGDNHEFAAISCASNALCVGIDEGGGVTVGTATSVPQRSLSVGITGEGRVNSAPAGIDCASSCTHSFDEGTSVTLTATPMSGASFLGWSGACSGAGSCQVSLNGDASVQALFTSAEPGGGGGGSGGEHGGGEPGGGSSGDGGGGAANPGGGAVGSGPSPAAAGAPAPSGGAATVKQVAGQKAAAARRQAAKKCKPLEGKAKQRCMKKALAIGRPKKSKAV